MYNLIQGNSLEALRVLPEKSVHAAVTSPPYWPDIRDYGGPKTLWPDGWNGCLGEEPDPQKYCDHLTCIFREVHRVLRDDGLLWVNIGDTFAKDKRFNHLGIKRKDLYGIPWQFAFTMRKDGWFLRNDDIWYKPDANPNSATDRTSRAHEYIFQFAKSENYYFDREAIRVEEKASKGKPAKSHYHRSIWQIAASNFRGAHFATFPEKLAATCIKASSSEHGVCSLCNKPFIRDVKRTRIPTRPAKENKVDTTKKACRDPLRHITKVETLGWKSDCLCGSVETKPAVILDPFNGAGTTGAAALRNKRHYVGVELFDSYIDMTRKRLDEIIKI